MRDLKRLLRYLRPYLRQMVAAALLLALAGGLMSVVVATVKPLVNQVLEPSPSPVVGAAPSHAKTGFDILDEVRSRLDLESVSTWFRKGAFVELPLLLIVVFFLRGIALYLGEYLTSKAGASVIRDIRTELYEAVTYQSLAFFQKHPTGLILSRILNDVARLQNLTTTVLADLFRVGAMVPFLLAVVLIHDWRMSLFALIVLPALAYPLVRLGRKLRKAATRSQETMAQVASLVTESVMGARVVQGFAMERFEIRRFGAALQNMLRVDLKAARTAALAPAIMEFVGAVAGAALFYFAGMWIHQGTLDKGDFWVVLGGLGLLFMSLRRLNKLNVEIQHGLSAATRIFQMLDRQREIRDLPDAKPLPPFESEVLFENVDFAYEEEKVLDAVRLTVRKGELVALVGASGSGKSTIANLIPRFYDPTAGRVAVDGHDIRSVTLASLREQIGLVTQETILFDDTVRNNIAYGRSDISLDRVVEAARAAHAHEFIERLPLGYDTRLGERGARLSMGQRQRITIARALLKDPAILILDEATSALDSESEMLVQQALATLMKGRTSVVIAHRLATVRSADRILVMDLGRIVEEGTHRDLLARGGLYARVHALQFQESPI